MNLSAFQSKLCVILGVLFSLLLLSGCLIDRLGGAFSRQPEELDQHASEPARKLIERAFDGIVPARLVDYHTHVVAVGTGGSGGFVNSAMLSGFNVERLKYWIYSSASGIKDLRHADEQYIARLVRLARHNHHGKFHILAFDKHYNRDGTVNLAKTTMYVPNRYVVELAQKYSDVFTPAISVHPYRADAVQELDRWGKTGVKHVKWLPNAMGIDPADPAVEPFYKKMKEHNMVLLSHAGDEQAVKVDEDQRLGNPLLLRNALDHGVRTRGESRRLRRP
jgi:predicted TIM-barrel fold metal-dependent hydrolase